MFRNHIQTAFRILHKQKLTAAIRLIGLGFGLSFFILLVAYVRDDLTFDRFHKKADQIHILTSEFRGRFTGAAHHFIAEMLESEFPEVEPGATLRYAMHSQVVRRGDRIMTKDFAFTDPNFFDLFSFDLVSGNAASALSEPHKVVITASTAQAFFSGEDPLGRTLSILIDDAYRDFSVSAVVADAPGNSSMRFDGLLHYSQVFDAYQIDKNNNDFVTLPFFTTIFLDLPDAKKAESLRAKLPAFNHRLYDGMWEQVKVDPPKTGFDLAGFRAYHLGDIAIHNLISPSRPVFSWVISGIALLILILACLNNVNLSLAQSSNRFKEIGVRKVVGARKNQLIHQLLTESLLTGMGALIIGFAAALFLLSPFNILTGKRLSTGSLFHPQTIFLILLSVLAVSFFTGLFPALSLSRYSAADVFRGRFLARKQNGMTLSLIVFQFTASLFFIIGTLVITRQLRFMTSTDLGYDPAGIILVHTQVPGERAPEGASLLEVYRNELRSDSRVRQVSADSGTVGTRHGSVTRRYDRDGIEHTVEAFLTDWNYLNTLNVPVVLGRDFSSERTHDFREGILVNETFVKDFELGDPVGKRFSDFAVDKLPAQYTFDPVIIGVVKDFHVASLHEPLAPMAFGPRGFPPIQRFRNILIKVKAGDGSSVLERLKEIWIGIRPDLPFSYTFLQDALAWEYHRERDWSRIVSWSAGFALIISCMGLFGLTAVTVVRRTKETGIRKVLGAGAVDILFLFSREILKWVLISNLIAWPIALIAARKWLEQFAYRIDIEWWMFVLAAAISFLIAGLTVGWHVVRAALSDPVQSLRYE